MAIKDFSQNGPPQQNGNNASIGSMMQAMMAPPSREEVNINDLLINYNEKYKDARPILFRDKEITQIIATTIGKMKPNSLLIGEAGTGKTKVVQEIARIIASNDGIVPKALKDFTIYELPLNNLLAGTEFRGQLEKKLKTVIQFAKDPKNKAIIFIDEIHQLMGDTGGYTNIAQTLKPALASGEFKCIGATTTQESKRLLNDPAFNRRFSKIPIRELDPDEVRILITDMLPDFVEHYGNEVTINLEILPTLIRIADLYSPVGSHRPDNAITLLDRIMADTVMKQTAKMLEAVKTNSQMAINILPQMPQIEITEHQIEELAIKRLRGTVENIIDFETFENELKHGIQGQDEILNKVIHLVKKTQLKLFDTKQPASMFFAGPTGTGKTETAKIMAKALTGVDPIILNMAEYNTPVSINRIIGSNAGYVGYDSNQEAPFDTLETNPYRVIVLDELEKADPSIQTFFMAALEEGYAITNKNTKIDFSRTIIIATTNAGQITQKKSIGFNTEPKISKSDFIDDLKHFFRLEFLNRFHGNLFQFNSISEDIYREIILKIYDEEYENVIKKKESYKDLLTNPMPDADLDEIVSKTYTKEFNARPAKEAVREYITDKLI